DVFAWQKKHPAFDDCHDEQKRDRRPPKRLIAYDEDSSQASDTEPVTPLPKTSYNPARSHFDFVSQPSPPKFRKATHSKGSATASQPPAPTLQPLLTTSPPSSAASIQAVLKMQEKAFKLLKEIKLKLDTLENAMENFRNFTEPNQTAADPVDGAMLSLLPLAIHSDLEELEQYLHTPKNRSDLVAHFSRLGGSSLQDALRQLMRRYIADTLAQDFSLTGRKGKRPFNTLHLLEVITETLKKVFATATEVEIHNGIADWLRYAPSRQKKRIFQCDE
ncbi:hypothetical protein MTO96_033724, partial [Rhipicephalus appendiculatus]